MAASASTSGVPEPSVLVFDPSPKKNQDEETSSIGDTVSVWAKSSMEINSDEEFDTALAKKLIAKGLASECYGCNALYKTITRNWIRDSSWKTWWGEKTETDRVLHYQGRRKVTDLR